MMMFRNELTGKLFDDVDIITIDYPGYGKSSGEPSQNAFYEMADALIQYTETLTNYDRRYVMGYSIGTGVAVYTAAQSKWDGLILSAPYDNMINVINGFLPIFKGPFARFVKNPFPSDSYAGQIEERTLIFCSKSDEVIDIELSRNLFEAIGSEKEIIEFEDYFHSEMASNETMMKKIAAFIR